MSKKSSTPRGLIRQGDVLLIPVDPDVVAGAAAPETRRVLDRVEGRLVLAEGEATGHAHVIVEDNARLESQGFGEFRRNRHGGSWSESRTVLIVEGAPVRLVHEEHDPLTVPTGGYLVRRQREYAPPTRGWDANWRRVAD